jgi:hypothetical protein
MAEILPLLLVAALLLSLARALASRRRRRTATPADSALLWSAALSGAEAAATEGYKKRRRRSRAATANADEGAIAAAKVPLETAQCAPRPAGEIGNATAGSPTPADLRRAIVWSAILAAPRGLATGEEPGGLR